MKVLIADDSEYIFKSLTAMLSKLPGIEIVAQSRDVPESIKSIRELKPDTVILDIKIPGGSGIDVLRKIKSNKHVPKVIILTNYPYPQYRKKCMELGADFFFDKSTEFKKVPEVLKQLMKNSLN